MKICGQKIFGRLSVRKLNVLKISSGTFLAQMLSILILPFVTRIYGATIIGENTTIVAVCTIITAFSDMGLTYAIMTSRDDEVDELYTIISTLIIAICILLSSVVITISCILDIRSETGTLFRFFFFVVYSITAQQLQVCYTYLNRNQEYNVLMKNPIINNSVLCILAIGLGYLGFIKYGYYISYLGAQFVTLIHMRRKLPMKILNFNFRRYPEVFMKNQKYLRYQLPSNIIGYVKNQLPVFILRCFWGAETVGYYSMAVKVLHMPSTLIASAIGRVFFSEVSRMKREGMQFGSFVYNNLIKGMKLATIPMALFIAFGDVVAVAFFGSDWSVAGTFIQVVALQYFFMFLNNTVQGLPIVLEKQNYTMIFFILQIIGCAIGAAIGYFVFDSAVYTLSIIALIFICSQIWFFAQMFKFMNMPAKRYILYSIFSILIIVVAAIALRITAEQIGIISCIYKIIKITT